MPEFVTCYRCGTRVPQASPEGCPACGAPLPAQALPPITVDAPRHPPARAAPRLSQQPTLPERRSGAPLPSVPHRAISPQDHSAGDYELSAILGEGGMGVVWSARQAGLDREVAIKRARPGPSARHASEALLAEAVLTGSLEHPGIVPVHEVGVDQDGMPFYSMRRLRGRTWAERWADLSQREHLDVLMRVADAVAYAHGQGVIHRDIKPDNVFLGAYGEVVLFDWGLAIRLDDLAAGRVRVTAAGTPAYMAPEMARVQLARLGPASDIYLLGGVLFEILTGQAPHPGQETTDILVNAAENRIDPAVPDDELGLVARQAMATDPADRFSEVRAFQQAVRTCLEHQESIGLTARARERLGRAREGGGHTEFARAVLAFEEALALWPDNHAAADGLAAARLAYAAHARASDDLELATSLLDPDRPEHRAELELVRAHQSFIVRRRFHLRFLSWASGGLVALMLVATTIGLMVMRGQRDLLLRISGERDAAEARLAHEEASMGAERRRMWRRVMQEDFASGQMPVRLRVASGRWQVEQETLLADGSGPEAGPACLILLPPGLPSAQIQCDVHDGGDLTLVCGVAAEALGLPGAGLEVELGRRLVVRADGREIASSPLAESPAGLPRRMRVELVDGTLRVLLDGHIAVARMPVAWTAQPEGVIGMRAAPGTRLDNLKVEVPWD